VRIETDRLVLRHWQDSDRVTFAALNSDPRVMRFMPAVLSRDESDAVFDRVQAHFKERGFGPFAVTLPPDDAFIGYVGLLVPGFEAHFTPCIEILWRLAAEHWNRGLATEGAQAVVRYAFETLGFDEVVSFTVPENLPSRRVMEKLGMTHDEADDFDHPGLQQGHPLRRHVLYRIPAKLHP
jgi:RimJ/RimL family protein N-acetyltransferase